MRTLEKTVYRFDELTTGAQETALEDARNVEYPFLNDDMQEKLEELLEENKLTSDNAKVRYSLSYSQGSGASFTGGIVYNKTWYGEVIVTDFHYRHWNSVDIETLYSLKTDKEAPESTVDKVNEIVHEIGKQLESYGYYLIECATSDEYLIQEFIDMGTEFNEDGSIYNGI